MKNKWIISFHINIKLLRVSPADRSHFQDVDIDRLCMGLAAPDSS